MKKFTKKSIQQKIIISILAIVLAINFIIPTYSHADIGGVLMDPITDLLCTVGDTVINLLQKCMTGDWGAGFSLFDGGFLTSSEDYNWNSEQSANVSVTEKINPDSEENGFNKTLITGNTQDYYIPTATYSPEQIFSGNVAGLNVNFFNPGEEKNVELINGKTVDFNSATTLQGTIASWYVALRNLTVVVLLSVLVYVGIRIIISSTASDKAKYKKMLGDWVIALCLVFCLHYIMSFTLTITDSICSAIGGDGTDTIAIEVEGKGTFTTNLLGAARFKTQYDDFGQKIAYLIMYLALVIYTVIFTWFYLKRLLMMAFLTMIAPVVALTYPIDKISDGKAQAFDSWLKEYVFNALIQPFHLIIYTVFVGTAMDLASTNIIYTIAALGFILPAEKILRKFFGFDKAGATLGTLGALGLGSMASKLLGGSKGGKKGISGGGTSESSDNKPPRFENKHDINEIESPNGDSSNSGNIGLDDNENEELSELGDYLDNIDYDDAYLLGDEYAEKQARYQELMDKKNAADNNNNQNQTDTSADSSSEDEESEKDNNSKFKNWARYHNINPESIYGVGKKAIGGAARFATKTAFKAGAGTLAGAVAMATGGGLAGGLAAYGIASRAGGKIGDKVADLGGTIYSGGERLAASGIAANKAETEKGKAFADRLLGGTGLGREIDAANGNHRFEDAGNAMQIKTDKHNLKYLRDQMAAANGGNVPSAREVKEKMNTLDPYIAEGLTEIKDMLKAQKAEAYGINAKQAALIAKIGKERDITADILNDDKKAKAQEANLRQDFINKGKSAAEAQKLADHTMNVWKVQNGVASDLKKK